MYQKMTTLIPLLVLSLGVGQINAIQFRRRSSETERTEAEQKLITFKDTYKSWNKLNQDTQLDMTELLKVQKALTDLMQKVDVEQDALTTGAPVPPPPMMPEAPATKEVTPSRGALLEEIQRGRTLKKVTEEPTAVEETPQESDMLKELRERQRTGKRGKQREYGIRPEESVEESEFQRKMRKRRERSQ